MMNEREREVYEEARRKCGGSPIPPRQHADYVSGMEHYRNEQTDDSGDRRAERRFGRC